MKKNISDIFIRCLTFVETVIGRITIPMERSSHRYLLAFNRWLLAKVDPLSYAIEGTVFKKVLQVTIYPAFLILTAVIGFQLVKNGYTAQTFFGNLLVILAIGIIFAPLERLLPFSRKWADDTDEPTDVMIFFGNIAWSRYINSAIELATISLVVQEISPHIGRAIWPAHWNPVVQVLLFLCVNDFFRYWYHRWMHENAFMWRWHSVHHSSKRLYWFNASRFHPIEGLVSNLLWGIPLAYVKAPVEIVFVARLLGRTLGRFQHTNMGLILGPLDYIFATPKNHRYHHSKKIEEGHKNYGGNVIIWDLLFGTFYLPKGKQPSDDIGIAEMPNYPQNWIGLMLAPFTFNKIKEEATQGVVETPSENSTDIREKKDKTGYEVMQRL